MGIQSMILTACKPGEKIIMPRNVHRSAINALVISGAQPIYVNPGVNKRLGIPLGMSFADVKKAIDDIKKGRVEYRTDSYGNVHSIIGKVSFDDAKLVENLQAFVSLIIKSKPSVVKGEYVKNISVSSTMGPGIKIDLNSFDI